MQLDANIANLLILPEDFCNVLVILVIFKCLKYNHYLNYISLLFLLFIITSLKVMTKKGNKNNIPKL